MKKSILTIGIILILASFMLILTGCGSEEKGLVGKWGYGSYVYTFNADKTGTYDASGTEMKFTYEDDGAKVSILYEGNTAPLVLEYKIDGKILTIKDSFGSDVTYEKK